MADLVTRLSLDSGQFDSGISSAINSVNKLDKQAKLASKGLGDFFSQSNTSQMREAFAGVDQVLKNLERTVSVSGGNMKKDLRAMTIAAQELEKTWRQLSAAEKSSGAGQELRSHIDELISSAGNLKDTMGDVQSVINFQASDTKNLDVLAQGLTTVSAGFQVAAGAASLFGVSEEKIAAVQKNLVAVMAITNGLQTIQNALQKDSALMTFIRIAREKGLAAALGIRTAATAATTAAETAQTAAVEANTAAWLTNPVGVVVVAVLALAAGIAVLTSKLMEDTEAEKGEAEAIKSVKSATEEGYKSYKKAELELEQLKRTVNNFVGTKKEEERLVNDLNQKYGTALGKYKDLDSWKKALANTSLYYCRVLQAEAKLAALNAEAYGAWAKAMAGEDYEKNMAKYKKLLPVIESAMDDVEFYNQQLKIARRLSGDISGVSEKSTSGKTKSGSSKTTKQDQTELEKYNQTISELQKKLDSIDKSKYPEQARQVTEQIVKNYRELDKFYDTTTEEGAKKHIDNLKKILTYYKVASNEYKQIQAEIEKANELLYVSKGGKIGDFGWQKQAIKNQIDVLQRELDHTTDSGARLTLEIDLEDVKKKLKKLESELPALNLEVTINEKFSRDKTFDYRKSELEILNEELEKATKNYEDLYNQFKENPDMYSQFEKAGEAVDSLRNKITQLNIQTDIKDYNKRLNELRENLAKNVVSGIRTVYDSISGIADKLENAKNSFEKILIVVEEFINIFDAVKSVIDTIKEITEVTNLLTGATQAATGAKEAENITTKQGEVESLANAGAKEIEANASAHAAGAEGAKAASSAMAQNASMGPWGWIAGIAAAVAVLAMLASIMGSFANGGIVGGNSYHGDRLYARVNSGEMILNQKQQANLFRLLDGGFSAGSSSGNVEFKIRGHELVGVLRNYNDKTNKLK